MSNDNFNFGMDDLWAEADNGRTMAGGVAKGIGLLFLGLSALTTFQFFAVYATAVGDWAGAAAAPLVAGLIGVACLDVGCMAWSYVRSRAATSGLQMTVSMVAAVADLVMSLIASGLFIILSTTLETGIYSADGSLTDVGIYVNYLGVAVITLALVLNFTCVFLWMNGGADTRAAEQQTSLRAVMAAGKYRVDAARTRLVVERTMHEIARALPQEAEVLARQQGQMYLDTTMRRPESAEIGPQGAPAPVVNMNGHGPTQRPTQGR